MHQAIMDFSSMEFYEGQLEPDESVRGHVLADLPHVSGTALSQTPVEFIDTAGASFDEEPEPDGESRLNRRLYAIPEGLWLGLFYTLAAIHQALNPSQEYSVDSFPLPVCDNYRIRHCRLYQGKAFHGKIASKWRYFYGLRRHQPIPVENAGPAVGHSGRMGMYSSPPSRREVRSLKIARPRRSFYAPGPSRS